MTQQIPDDGLGMSGTVRPVAAFRDTYGGLFGNIGAFMKLVALPLILIVALAFWQTTQQIADMRDQVSALQQGAALDAAFPFSMEYFLLLIAQVAIAVAFATVWHRYWLLGPGSLRWALGLQWRKAEWLYLLWCVVVYVLFLLYSGLVLGLLGGLIFGLMGPEGAGPSPGLVATIMVGGSLLMLAGAIYLYCRVCLIFPGVAIGAGEAFRTARRVSKGRVFRMFLAFLLVFLPLLVLQIVLSGLFFIPVMESQMALMQIGADAGAVLEEYARLMRWVIAPYVLLLFAYLAVFVSALSVLYSQLITPEQAKVADVFGEG